jgi:hypothetical protein
MRTTLSIEDDVLVAVKELADKEGVTAGEKLARLVRQALQAPTVVPGQVRHGVPVFPRSRRHRDERTRAATHRGRASVT